MLLLRDFAVFVGRLLFGWLYLTGEGLIYVVTRFRSREEPVVAGVREGR